MLVRIRGLSQPELSTSKSSCLVRAVLAAAARVVRLVQGVKAAAVVVEARAFVAFS